MIHSFIKVYDIFYSLFLHFSFLVLGCPKTKKSPAFLLNWWFLKRHKTMVCKNHHFWVSTAKNPLQNSVHKIHPNPNPSEGAGTRCVSTPPASGHPGRAAWGVERCQGRFQRETREALGSLEVSDEIGQMGVMGVVVPRDPWGYGSPKFQNGQKLWLIHDPNYLVKVPGRKWMDERLGSAIDPNHWS